MTSATSIPTAAEAFLDDARGALREREIDRLRLYPLVLSARLSELVNRRKKLFDTALYTPTAYGFEVTFRRHLKPSPTHPKGRECQGVFHLLAISDNIVLVASSLASDDHKHGPRRFAENAYPLARRPFFASTTLVRLVDRFAGVRKCTAITLDTWGYHRKSHRQRRDLERQAPADAAREMAEQGRQIHQTKVSFRRRNREVVRLSFDRSAALTLFKGSPAAAVRELTLPGIAESTAADATYEISRTTETDRQEVVELTFIDEPLDSYDAMHALCDAVRLSDGLNVAVIHLNPYLQAQVLDFYTGAAVEMLVTDNRSISLVPRSKNAEAAIRRIATTIFRYFGEGKPKRTPLDGL